MKIDSLFPGIDKTCKKCNTCCRTYGWLSNEEAKKFIKKGYPVAKINNKLYCIDSFVRDSKNQIIADKIPLCIFYKNRRCLIQKNKPLDCRLYPLKIKFYKDYCVLGLSLGCKYLFNLNKLKKEHLYQRVIRFIKKMPKKELNDYLNLMQEVNLISKPKRFWMKRLIEFKKVNKWKIFRILKE